MSSPLLPQTTAAAFIEKVMSCCITTFYTSCRVDRETVTLTQGVAHFDIPLTRPVCAKLGSQVDTEVGLLKPRKPQAYFSLVFVFNLNQAWTCSNRPKDL